LKLIEAQIEAAKQNNRDLIAQSVKEKEATSQKHKQQGE
jgi:hypothetical protein